MVNNDLTYRINGCAMTAHRKLGRGFREYVYCRALAIELGYENLLFEREVWLPIHYDGFRIAARRVDFLVDKAVTVEVKAKSQLTNEDKSQAINTLERLNVKCGLLLNFGALALEFHHLFNNKYDPTKVFEDITPALVGEPSDDLLELRNYIPDWVINKMQYDKFKKK